MSSEPSLANVLLYESVARRLSSPIEVARLLEALGTPTVNVNYEYGMKPMLFGPPPGTHPAPGTSHLYQVYPFVRVVLGALLPDDLEIEGVGTGLLELELSFEVTYALGNDEAAWKIEEFGDSIRTRVQADVWPYYREAISTFAQRLGFGPIPFPSAPPSTPEVKASRAVRPASAPKAKRAKKA